MEQSVCASFLSFLLILFLFLSFIRSFLFLIAFLFVPSLIITFCFPFLIISLPSLPPSLLPSSSIFYHHRFSRNSHLRISTQTASRTTRNMNGISSISDLEQEALLLKLEVFKIKGKDKPGRAILRIIGKFFPVSGGEDFPKLEKRKFAVVYVHSGVDRCENFPGISARRSIYEAIPMNVKENLEAVYFIHPGLQSQLFLATFGRLLLTPGLYGKLRYMSRVDYLWEHVNRNDVQLPEFVYDHDKDLEYRSFMDYGLERDHRASVSLDSPLSTYSLRCIS